MIGARGSGVDMKPAESQMPIDAGDPFGGIPAARSIRWWLRAALSARTIDGNFQKVSSHTSRAT